MKISTLPTVTSGHNKTRKKVFYRVDRKGASQIIDLLPKGVKRSLSFISMLLAMFFGIMQQGFGQGSQTITSTSTTTFRIPIGVTSVTVEVWGGGGKGGSTSNGTECGGGGGGAYSRSVLTVVSGNTYNLSVGAGSTGTSAGGDSYFINTTTLLAKGGNSVANNSATGVSGGAAGSGAGDVTRSGGGGANGSNSNYGGGGGSSAGTALNGVTATNQNGANAPAGGGDGGDGRSGSSGPGSAGSVPGGGGGGCRASSSSQSGGNGANGQIIISWTCPTASISYALASFCKSETLPQSVILSGSAGGTFSSSPSGLSIDPATGSITPSSSNANTYTVTYNIPAAGGCSAVNATASVTINALVTPAVSVTALPGNSVCEGTGVTFTATASNTGGGTITYDFKLNGGSVQSGAANTYSNSLLIDGNTVSCDISIAGGACLAATTASSNLITMSVNAIPTITGTVPGTRCGPGTVTLGATASAGTLNWYADLTGGPSLGTGASFLTPDISSNTTFYVDATANGCTTATRTPVLATVNPLPDASISYSKLHFCQGTGTEAVVQTGQKDGTYTSEPAGLSIDLNSGTIDRALSEVGNYTVTYTFTDGTCPNTTTTAVSIDAPLAGGAGSNSPVCEGSTLSLSSPDGGATYSWTGPNGQTASVQNPDFTYVTTSYSGTWTVIIVTGCGSTTLTTDVIVNPQPEINILALSEFACLNSSGNIFSTETDMTKYVWNIPGAIINSGSGTYSVSVTWISPGIQPVSINYEDANGCSAILPQVYNVTVYDEPVIAITGAASSCVNSTGNVYTTDAGMTNYLWSVSAGGTITDGPGTNEIKVTWNTTGPHSVSVNYTDGNGCSAALPTIHNVTVNPLPVPTISGSASVCDLSAIVYTTQPGMTNYSWSVTGGAITGDGGLTNNTATVTWNGVGPGTISVNYNDGNSCSAAAPSVYNVTVNSLPVPTITGPSPVCLNSTGNVYYTESGMTGYSWSISGGNITAGTGTNLVTVTWISTTSPSISVNYADLNGCRAAASTIKTVTVNSLPVAIAGSNSPVCAGLNINLTSGGGMNYSWTGTNGFLSTEQNPVISGPFPLGTRNYTVIVTDGNGCTLAASTSVQIVTMIDVLASSNSPVCEGSTLNLSSTSGGTGATYSWTGPNGFTSTSRTPSINSPTPLNNGMYIVTVTSPTCGSSTATTNVTINPLPTITLGPNPLACRGTTSVNLTYSATTESPDQYSINYDRNSPFPDVNDVAFGSSPIVLTVPASVNTGNYHGIFSVRNSITGCVSNDYDITVIVNASPTATINGNGTASFCTGGSTTLSANVGMSSYQWNLTGDPIDGATSSTLSVDKAGSYTVTVTNSNGCSATSSATVVTENPLPTMTLGALPSACEGATSANLNYSATTGNPNHYSIAYDGTAISAGFISVTNVGLGFKPGWTHSFFNVATVSSNSPVCEGSVLNLTSGGGVSYFWTGPNGFSSNDQIL